MTFARVNPPGWDEEDDVTPEQMNQLDINVSRALDGNDGGNYNPANPLDIGGGGLRTNGDDVAGLMTLCLRNWSVCNPHDFAAGITLAAIGGFYDATARLWILVGDGDECVGSRDDGETFSDQSGSMGSSVDLRDAASGGSSSAIACGESATMYRCTDITAQNLTWATVTAPGTPTKVFSVEYDTGNSRYVIVGQKAGPTPYVATSNNSTGSAWTDRSAGLPAGFAALALGSVAVGDGEIVAAAASAHTKLARSANGGVNWLDSTTTLNSGRYQVAYSEELGMFVAVRVDSTSANYVYTSEDASTWTLRFSGSLGFGGVSDDHHLVTWFGRAIVVAGQRANGNVAFVSFSMDLGVTWEAQNVSREAGGIRSVTGSTVGGRLVVGWDIFASRSMRRGQG